MTTSVRDPGAATLLELQYGSELCFPKDGDEAQRPEAASSYTAA
jgi:hypothetical protein